VVSFNNEIILAGGKGNNNSLMNDVWKSTNGIDWNLVRDYAEFPERADHRMVV